MSKMKLLLDVISNIRSVADSLEALAKAMADGDVQNKEPLLSGPKKSERPQETHKPAVSHEMIRGKAATIAKAGKRDAIKTLLTTYGVKNVTAIKKDDLEGFYTDLLDLEDNVDATT